MENKLYITTTNKFENGEIQKYMGLVCTNVVVGTNVFSDFAASFTDFFGGKSNSYRNKLEYIYKEALKDLENRTRKLGANAIVGARIDFDEISGKDKSMFMVSISGTACRVNINESEIKEEIQSGIIEQEVLEKEIKKREIIKSIKENQKVEEEWIEFMQENPIKEIIPDLIGLYIAEKKNYRAVDGIFNVIKSYNRGDLIPILYDKILDYKDFQYSIDIIKRLKLFDANRVLNICKNDLKKGILLLNIEPNYYKKEELEYMKGICQYYENMPNTGKIEKLKTGVFNKKEEDKFICENGHTNNIDSIFCAKCGVNINGLNEKEFEEVNEFKNRVQVLIDILK
ncbi:YbjQ family protein [Paraprevotella xylaniphila]|uniref:UPF0145 protein HMPREF9442_00562 n=1 Tax=Paraprevotella xylaniphila YIT 11841 TaxID=762982 RepID=F3QQW9_9BACT|nr:YbjQ family protein [Paraprevotella xylaniphila]EGG56560.1 hypothetical protein HMPREF9442_00562 [Paraprevotella xylaniphila YIT 11841]